jgi:hypothetical protein
MRLDQLRPGCYAPLESPAYETATKLLWNRCKETHERKEVGRFEGARSQEFALHDLPCRRYGGQRVFMHRWSRVCVSDNG